MVRGCWPSQFSLERKAPVRSRFLAFCLLGLGLIVSGCGNPKGPETARISGTITRDGQPLEKGIITFKDSTTKTVSPIPIEKGKYSGVVFPGQMRVEIGSKKVTGQRKAYDTPDSPMVDVTEEDLPAEYNVNSNLTFEVKPGNNSFDYDMKTR